jgi:L-serine/L-threonine ammonia-lyase
MGAACLAARDAGATRVVSASGGNAGFAVAWAARRLGLGATIVVPASASGRARQLITDQGAELEIHGADWDDAHDRAVGLAAATGARYIHPFDDPVVWQGHATLVHEIARTIPRPDAFVVAVGGGGLLAGVVVGLDEVGWHTMPVVAVETDGAASLAESMRAGHLVTLDAIRSVATTLGARRVAPHALDVTRTHDVRSLLVSDRQAVTACRRFVDDHRVLVEPACGAALAAVYDSAPPLAGRQSIVVVVCGGAGVTLELLDAWSASSRRPTPSAG